jgi:phage shock protein A
MTLLDRLSRLIRANLSDLLRRAEDPEKIINQALEDMKEALREAREQVAAAMAEGKRLEREVESHLQEATLWEEKAKEALKAGREDLAKEALRRRKRALDLAEGFKQQAEEQKALIERLMTQLKALEAKIRAQAKRLAERKAEAERLKEILENLTLTIPVRAGETKIYGSVTAKDVAEALSRQHGITIDPKRLVLEKPIKELGEYVLTYKPHPEVPIALKVSVVAQ